MARTRGAQCSMRSDLLPNLQIPGRYGTTMPVHRPGDRVLTVRIRQLLHARSAAVYRGPWDAATAGPARVISADVWLREREMRSLQLD